MLSLDPIEASFAGAVWATSSEVPSGILPPRNFNIYRNNVYAGLMKSIGARFPVIKRLVGDDFFAACARVFVERHPPTSPVLLWYGEHFSKFLASFEPARGLAYLAAVAELEWQRHVVQHGPDAQPLDATTLATLPMAEVDLLVFDLHPTCHVSASLYPMLSIWRTNTVDSVTQSIPAEASGETVLLVRPHDTVLLLPLINGGDIFVAQLQQSIPLGRAAAVAQHHNTTFDLAGTLAMLLRADVFTGFHLTSISDGK